jgi:hypothetical protein
VARSILGRPFNFHQLFTGGDDDDDDDNDTLSREGGYTQSPEQTSNTNEAPVSRPKEESTRDARSGSNPRLLVEAEKSERGWY